MENYQMFAAVMGVWCTLYLIDSYFKFNASERWQATYQRVITDNGITLYPARCQLYSRRLNRMFLWLGQMQPSLLEKWFDLGIIAALLCGCCSLVFLCMVPINTLFRSQSKDEQILKPVIPGVNLPRKDLGYYLVTLFLSAVLHEFGHAIAAVRESVKVNGFGVFIFVVYPGAFVDMDNTTLFAVSSWKQLRIFCGGVWHNIVIVLFGILFLYSLPLTLSPFYTIHESLVMVSHTEKSVVLGESGLSAGDIITQMDSSKVNSVADWMKHLVSAVESPNPVSYAVPKTTVLDHDTPMEFSEKECICKEDSQICFSFNTYTTKKLEDIRCMSAREVITYNRCSQDSSVDCIAPYIGHVSNYTRLIVIYRSKKPPVLFYGHPAELHQSVVLGEVVPKYDSTPLWIPYALESLFKSFISLSGALAILNIVPCYALDGQYIAQALVSVVFSNYSDKHRELILTIVVVCGTFLLCSNLFLAMYGLLF